ncbi:MAG: GDP-mannose 4,6-dehydratase [Verrucomicrobiia bacterium]
MKTCLVIGASGQDGTFLAELLARRGDRVVCISRSKTWSVPAADWERVDILQRDQVLSLMRLTQPAECYYLPAYHHSAEEAGLSSGDPQLFERSHAVHVRGLIYFNHAIAHVSPHTRLFYAASSHVFGQPSAQPQDESTPLNPENVYGITKTMGIHCCRHFRKELNVYAAVGILYNHESHLRPPKFLSQKIVNGVLAFRRDRSRRLALGDLNVIVDWGYAPDYAEAMTRILNHPTPEDFIVATGISHTVGEFLQTTCEIVGVDWRECVVVDAGLLQKKPVLLVGDCRKLQKLTGWQPATSFRGMIEQMLERARQNGR